MINDLEEAIQHCLEVAEENLNMVKDGLCCNDDQAQQCLECGKEHRQLAEWLKALKEIWDSGSCNDCKFSGHCEIQPKLGQLARFNCYHYVGVANEEVNADES